MYQGLEGPTIIVIYISYLKRKFAPLTNYPRLHIRYT